ncbi:MAG: NAD-glutamate dehydrogenase [Oligoflexales bacterium]|nr:NAD-glutamate dehydrogenase [Oligoflexales bacterium]
MDENHKRDKLARPNLLNEMINMQSNFTGHRSAPDAELSLSEYDAEKKGEDLEAYVEDIADTVRMGLDQSIAVLTPWFFNNMPMIYYQTTPRTEKVRHLSSIISGHIFETKQTVELWNRDKTKVTFIGPGNDRKILVDMARRLGSLELKLGAIYFSHDNLLFLATFLAKGFRKPDSANTHIQTKLAAVREVILKDYAGSKEEVEHFLKYLDHDFIAHGTTARIQNVFHMVRYMMSHESSHSFFELEEDALNARLTIGYKEVRTVDILENILHLVSRYGFDIVRSFVVQFDEGYKESINVMSFVLKKRDGEKIDPQHVSVKKLIKALRTLGWVDSDDYAGFTHEPHLFSINAANYIRSIASWVHIILSKKNPYYYSEYKIFTSFLTQSEITSDLIELFRDRFDPLYQQEQEGGYAKKKADILKKMDELLDPIEKSIFQESVNFTDHILRTNYFFPTKTGLAFKLSPDVLDPTYYPQKPFGIFYVVGRDFRFFQVRWREIARGGLRVVIPKNKSDYSYALAGLFDEVYGLSLAQQLKNKDIPEGGSKAVMVLKPDTNRIRAVKGAINAFLDLLVREDESHEERHSRLLSGDSADDIIYLGPDENLTNELIVWISEQAHRRGYPYARAFISSRPGAGINHKEYGVTSEGLQVFLDHMLKFLEIDPRQSKFTIKMTGGPDGDVAGNALKILHREYAENARIVTIADGFGAAYDPDGLNWDELLRLVKTGSPISHFNKQKLSSPEAFVILADTAENMRRRNELHFAVPADIFIPAGGRPYTVNSKNCLKFLDAAGSLTCKAVVEGANIFFTSDSRPILQEKGLLFIKDSSANKAGVICSSFEVIASLILTEQEFLELKAIYVKQVVDILRKKADLEANLLFREYQRNQARTSLVDLSSSISKEINYVTDVLLETFAQRKEEVLGGALFQKCILKHCPEILVERYKDRLIHNLPEAHKIAILSAYMASYVVYSEGLGWLGNMDKEECYRAVVTYMKHVEEAELLISEIEKSKLSHKKEIVSILKKSGARELTILELEN